VASVIVSMYIGREAVSSTLPIVSTVHYTGLLSHTLVTLEVVS
jgi:hypothetical protein